MTSERPIFVVGCPRSGTTLLRSILDAHPRICCPAWETGAFVYLAHMLDRDNQWHVANDALIGDLRPQMVLWARRTFEDIMQTLTGQVGKPRWAEKTPAHVLHIKLIHEVFPEAQFLHIIRNGKDVVRSLQNMSWTPRRIRWSSRRWIDSIYSGRDAAASLPAGSYLEVRYEELTNKPQETVQEICTFLDEPFDPKMLEFNRAENNSWRTERQPLQAGPMHEYPKLSFMQNLIFRRMAGNLMRELGY